MPVHWLTRREAPQLSLRHLLSLGEDRSWQRPPSRPLLAGRSMHKTANLAHNERTIRQRVLATVEARNGCSSTHALRSPSNSHHRSRTPRGFRVTEPCQPLQARPACECHTPSPSNGASPCSLETKPPPRPRAQPNIYWSWAYQRPVIFTSFGTFAPMSVSDGWTDSNTPAISLVIGSYLERSSGKRGEQATIEKNPRKQWQSEY